MQRATNDKQQTHILKGGSSEIGDVLGANKRGAYVVFRYFDPFADRVFVIGSFNGWGESLRMERSRDGIWTAMVSHTDCPVGSTYKYKVYIGEDVKYITDPYSEKNDGAPYYNSVVSRPDGYVWGDGAFLESNAAVYNNGFENEPLHIYELRLDGWCAEHLRWNATYESLAKELSVYAKQMRYTHVLLDDVFAKYFNMDSGSYSVAYYAPNTRFGDAHSFRRFVDIMHRANIGVIIDCNFDGGADIYSRYELCSATVLYWMRNYHIDGVLLSVNGKRSADMAANTERAVHSMRCDAAVIVRGEKRFVRLVENCIPWITNRTNRFSRFFVGDLKKTKVSKLGFALSRGEELIEIGEKQGADEHRADEWRTFAGARALSACAFTACCKKATFMGQEIGEAAIDFDRCVRWEMTDGAYHAKLQLCLSDLGELYLSDPTLWQNDNIRTIDESRADIGVISFERTLGAHRILVVVNMSANVYEYHGISVSHAGVYEEIFNSDSTRYGGSGVVNREEIRADHNKKGGAIMYVKVPPLAVSVFRQRES